MILDCNIVLIHLKFSEFGAISAELNSIYQAGFLGFLTGAIYGGVIQSRVAYMNFMENNEATAFNSHLDAKVCLCFIAL